MGQAMTLAIRRPVRVEWLVAALGFAAMYAPVYWWAAHTLWQTDEQAHGAIIFAVVIWLFWQKRREVAEAPEQPMPWLGWPLFISGLLVYVVGRALSITVFEFGSQVLIVTGGLLLLKGRAALRAAWFPVLFMVFMIPVPTILVDAMTGTLKQWVSVIAENLLYSAGYPIGRSGVMLTIGQYQLLVADACSGLHSMFSLSALGVLFMYLMARKSVAHNVIMLASILPIAFTANIIRVMVLVLVTYYLGDEAGQGFLHGAAGMVLMGAALAVLVLLDSLLALVLKPKATPSA
jgi:exosortase B